MAEINFHRLERASTRELSGGLGVSVKLEAKIDQPSGLANDELYIYVTTEEQAIMLIDAAAVALGILTPKLTQLKEATNDDN